MFTQDVFLRLPRPTVLLLLSSLLSLTSAHVLPRQTPTTVPYRPLNVVAYPPLPAPTSPPVDLQTLKELLKRQDSNTVCGYIGGDPSLPATCSAGSHCVVDADYGVVGCCPDGQDTCTQGVFTGCVDSNSGAQTEVNPYVYTCTGSNVCYQNEFEGGFSQWGCGTASDLAATVSESATGVTSEVELTSVSVSLTQSPSSLAASASTEVSSETQTSGSTAPSSSETVTDTTGASSSASMSSLTTLTITSPTATADPTATSDSSSSESSSSPSSSASTNTSAPTTSGSGGGDNNTGAIVGGTIGGVAAAAGIAAAAIYIWRRRAARNARQGPGPRPGDTKYISPMSGGDGFTPLPGEQPASVRGKTITHITGGPDSRNTVWQYGEIGDDHDNHHYYAGGGQRGQRPSVRMVGGAAGAGLGMGMGMGMMGTAAYEGAYASPHDSSGEDEVPLRHSSPEIEDFSRGFHDALSRIGEEDEDELDEVNGNGTMSGGTNGGGSGSGDLGDSRPLWLQSRRQSRNLMWT